MKALRTAGALVVLAGLVLVSAVAQNTPRSTADSVRGHFDSVNRRVLGMAKDFPEEKYDYRLTPEMRSFGAVIVHIASGNVYAAKAGRGEKVNWDELDPNNYKTKTKIIGLMEKSIADADATLKNVPDETFAKSVEPWLGVTEHTAEHYGLLVAYYRANGLVPPASRLKK
jgi:DinB superfamily